MDSPIITVITPAHILKAYSYTEYRALIDELLSHNKTTGHNHSPNMLQYTKLNTQRMSRLDKTALLNENLVEKLQLIPEPWIWLILIEAWCGDAAQLIPFIAKMANLSHNISLKFLLRDENPDVMDQYLTNGTRSIPKLICLKSSTLEEIGTWGPRPQPAQQMVLAYKKNPQLYTGDFKEVLHSWYTKDKGQHLQQEFEQLILQWVKR
jgi:hypothetical protein